MLTTIHKYNKEHYCSIRHYMKTGDKIIKFVKNVIKHISEMKVTNSTGILTML